MLHRRINICLLLIAACLFTVDIFRKSADVSSSHSRHDSPETRIRHSSPSARRSQSTFSLLDECGNRTSASLSCVRHVQCTIISSTGNDHEAALPVVGDGFQELFVIGEPLQQRQWRRTPLPVQRRSVDWLSHCAEGSEQFDPHAFAGSVHPHLHVSRIQGSSKGFEVFSGTYYDQSVGCIGMLLIAHERHQAADPPLLRDEDDDSFRNLIKEKLRLGPDDFRIRVVGSSVLSHLVSYCRRGLESTLWYVFPFWLQSSEPHHLEIEHVYENYKAFDQQSEVTIPMVRRPLLTTSEARGSRGEIVGSQHHDPRLNLFRFHHPDLGRNIRKSKFRSSKSFVWDQFTFRSNVTVLCPNAATPTNGLDSARTDLAREPIFSLEMWQRIAGRGASHPNGVWVRSHLNTSFPRHLSPTDMQNEMSHHVHFERHDPQAVYEYKLYSDTSPTPLAGFSPCSLHRLISGRLNSTRSIVFVGDSHLRVTFTHLRNLLTLGYSSCPLEDHKVKSMSGKRCKFDDIFDVSYVNDVLLNGFLTGTNQVVNADVLVLGMGSWALGGRGSDPAALANSPSDFGRWKLSKYKRFMERVSELISTKLSENPQLIVVWLSMPAYPLNTRRFSKLKGEHRTNPRIFTFNEIAKDSLIRLIPPIHHRRVRFVDAFDITYPMAHLSLDHNHFTTYPQDAILHCLLNAMV